MQLSQYRKRFEKEYSKHVMSDVNLFDKLNIENALELDSDSLPIEKELFYYSKPVIEIWSDEGALAGRVEKNNIKMLYLSYKTLDNDFAFEPESSLFQLEKNTLYYIDIEIDEGPDIDVVPNIIHYSGGEKSRLTKIVEQKQPLKFASDEDRCRLTFKLRGHGSFKIKRIHILKFRQGDE